MKTFFHTSLVSLLTLAGAALIASASSAPSLDITVSSSAGKTVSKLRSDSQGNFTTPSLAPGNYTVLFKSKQSFSGQYSLVINEGKATIGATVRGQKFSQGGIAMRIQVAKAESLTGQIMDAKSAAAMAAMKKTTTASASKSPSPTPTVTKPSSMVF